MKNAPVCYSRSTEIINFCELYLLIYLSFPWLSILNYSLDIYFIYKISQNSISAFLLNFANCIANRNATE